IERDTRPNDVQRRTARALIDLGADVVIGAHPHVVQSFEYYNGKPIVYSLGNFIFNSRNPETLALFITIDGKNITLRAVPCKMSGTLTYAADDGDAAALLKKWSALSYGCAFTADGELILSDAAPIETPEPEPPEETAAPDELPDTASPSEAEEPPEAEAPPNAEAPEEASNPEPPEEIEAAPEDIEAPVPTP
ncbi:MAG: CapA family protein, partial [Oscillospiraceae bacterium]|nr:CapA family protein [Oscillospiraceae bacterium]